ncbi:MAG: cation transporter [Spirochaetia bacterium]|nr:cation transporter [Spirochaetia bacterium]
MNKKQKLAIAGMTCNHCAIAVEKAFLAVEGVESAEVNLDQKSALIVYDADKVSAEKLTAALNETNYTASLQ